MAKDEYWYQVGCVKDSWYRDFTVSEPLSFRKAKKKYKKLVATGEYRAVWISKATWNMVRVYQNPDKEAIL